jgi:hypothetical protein
MANRPFLTNVKTLKEVRQALERMKKWVIDTLGTMSTQDADSVAITGGTIAGTDVDVTGQTLTLDDKQIDTAKIGTSETVTSKILQPDGAGGVVFNAASGAVDHGSIGGLNDDDHTHYLLADGTRTGASSQAQDFGSNGIKADVVAESTGGSGVTIDGVLLKDGGITGGTGGDVIFKNSGGGNGYFWDSSGPSHSFTADVSHTFPVTMKEAYIFIETPAFGTPDAISVLQTGASYDDFILKADGKMEWGGGAGATDTNLYRSAANTLKTDDAFVVGGGFSIESATPTLNFIDSDTDDDNSLIWFTANATATGSGVEVGDLSLWGRAGIVSLEYIRVDGSAGDIIFPYGLTAESDIIVPKTSGTAIKIDTASPDYGWADILGYLQTRPAAGLGSAAVPDFVDYASTGIYAYRFGTAVPNNHEHEIFVEFHIPHDYAPGTDLYIHIHWSQTTVDTGGAASAPGNAHWEFDVHYAKGHGTAGGAARGAFGTVVSPSVTQQGSTTQYGHMIAEVQLSDTSPSASQLDSDDIEVDGLILVRLHRDPAHANDTLDQDTFVHFIDIHYQSTNLPTKQKAPDFYT